MNSLKIDTNVEDHLKVLTGYTCVCVKTIAMDTTTPYEDSFLDTFGVSSSTASSIHVGWHIKPTNLPFVEGFRVHYQKIASTYIQYGPKLRSSESEYDISNLVADTYYKVCLVVYRNDSIPYRECTDASTTNWQLPVSIGSSIGAVLALSMIVLIVLLSRCHFPLKYRGQKSKRSNKYDTISSTYHDDQYEFSETVTHGNDEDFTSEFDDDLYYEIPLHECKKSRQSGAERGILTNGLCRGHVHPHCHNQQRHSLGRIQCSQPHHHTRQFRAYSIQADGNACFYNQPCSPLAKEPRKVLLERETSKPDDILTANSMERLSRKAANDHSPTQCEMSLPVLETRSPHVQGFTFIDFDVIPEVSSKGSSKSNTSIDMQPGVNATPTPTTTTKQLLITDIDDISSLGATGGVPEPNNSGEEQCSPLEMTSTQRMFALPESVSFDEHTV